MKQGLLFPKIERQIPIDIKPPNVERPIGMYYFYWAFACIGCFCAVIMLTADPNIKKEPNLIGASVTFFSSLIISFIGHRNGEKKDKRHGELWDQFDKQVAPFIESANATVLSSWRPHGQIITRDNAVMIPYRNGNELDILQVQSDTALRIPGPTPAFKIKAHYKLVCEDGSAKLVLKIDQVTIMDPTIPADLPNFGPEASAELTLSIAPPIPAHTTLKHDLDRLNAISLGAPGPAELEQAIELLTALQTLASTNGSLSKEIETFIGELRSLRETMDELAIQQAFRHFRNRMAKIFSEVEVQSLEL